MRKLLVVAVIAAMLAPVRGDALGLPVPGTNAEIVRDAYGVPHIYADTARDLFAANGYAQAQDRLIQMEILRHVGKGRLAELTGRSGLALDLVTRRELYTDEERLAAFRALDPEWQAAFQAFADGVNRWIDEVRLDPTKLPAEYPALVEVPDPWKPTDTLAIAQYLLDVFGRGGGGQEVQNAQIFGKLTETLGDEQAADAALADLVWVQRNQTYTTIKPEDAPAWATPAAERVLGIDNVPAAQREAIAASAEAKVVDDAHAFIADAARAAGLPFKGGSNAQLISGRFTASGKPILYGGPQMAYFNPMVPYELGLHGAGYDAVGMGVAGTPGVIIGRTRNQSWTVTSGSSDQVDIVAEKLTGKQTYLVDGQERQMDCRTELHAVRPGPAEFAGGDPEDPGAVTPDVVKQEVCRTIHGPVIWRSADGRYAFASQRSYRGDEARSGTLWLGVGRTRTMQEFRDLFETFRFEFNFNYVNEAGDIMYMHVGAQPVRDPRLDPRYPRPGWDSTYEWDGILTGSDLPHVINPASGYTVNWNNNPAQGWPSGDVREQWGDVHRSELMHNALKPILDRGNVTIADVEAVNEFASTHEPFAGDFYDLFHGAAVALGDTGAQNAFEDWRASSYDWYDRDADGFHDQPGFRLYELWRERMQSLVFDDEIDGFVRKLVWDPPTSEDPHAADHGNTDNKHTILAHIATGQTAHAWCDRVDTPAPETCADLSVRALADAIADEPNWSAPFPMRKIRAVALGAGESYEIPMQNKPSFQHFYDWGLPEGEQRSRNALPPGNSGHMTIADFVQIQMGSDPRPHSNDQLQMYIDFRTKPLLIDAPGR